MKLPPLYQIQEKIKRAFKSLGVYFKTVCGRRHSTILPFMRQMFNIRRIFYSTSLRLKNKISYSNVLKNLRIDKPREVSLCRTEVPADRFIKSPAMPRRRMCSEIVLKLTPSLSEVSKTESSGSRP